jgi:hypothetical protein
VSTPSTRIGLAKPVTADQFTVAGLNANWDLLDAKPGIHVATNAAAVSTLAGAWGANQAGMFVFQIDTSTLFRWSGTAFVRPFAKGLLANPGTRTTDLGPITDSNYATLATCTVTVPSGGRNIRLVANWADISGGQAQLAFFRGATELNNWKAAVGAGGAKTFVDLAPAAGSTTYTVKAKNASTTTTVKCAALSPGSIAVEEV